MMMCVMDFSECFSLKVEDLTWKEWASCEGWRFEFDDCLIPPPENEPVCGSMLQRIRELTHGEVTTFSIDGAWAVGYLRWDLSFHLFTHGHKTERDALETAITEAEWGVDADRG